MSQGNRQASESSGTTTTGMLRPSKSSAVVWSDLSRGDVRKTSILWFCNCSFADCAFVSAKLPAKTLFQWDRCRRVWSWRALGVGTQSVPPVVPRADERCSDSRRRNHSSCWKSIIHVSRESNGFDSFVIIFYIIYILKHIIIKYKRTMYNIGHFYLWT